MPSTIRGSDNFDSAGGNACKAWVNFNGTGTVAIRAAFNVSSITDNGVGDYTVNFTSALADANYAGVFGNIAAGSGVDTYMPMIHPSVAQTASAFRFEVGKPGAVSGGFTGTLGDISVLNASFFR